MKELLDQSCLPLGDVLLVLLFLTKSGTEEDNYVDMDMCIRLRDGPGPLEEKLDERTKASLHRCTEGSPAPTQACWHTSHGC